MLGRDATQHQRVCAALISVASLAGCTAPESKPLAASDIAHNIADRTAPSSEQLRNALDLYDVPPLGLVLPTTLDPRDDSFWHAHALAFHPDVRAARRTWRARRAAIHAGGNPEPVVITGMVDDFSDTSRKQELAATVDLFGVLGFGSTPAERDELALIADVAHSELEQTAWRALFAMDAARIRLAAAHKREQDLAGVVNEARKDLARLTQLHDLGRLAPQALDLARAAVATLEVHLADLATDAVSARAELAISAGLPADADALKIASTPWEHILESRHDAIEIPTSAELFDRLPRLRAATRDYALAEARVRSAAATAWPTLRVGPSLEILPDERLLGGIVSLDLPWPSAVSARIEAALEDREAARESLEDALIEALARASARAEQLDLAHTRYGHEGMLGLASSAWRATRAHISVQYDFSAVDNWAGALGMLDEMIVGDVTGRERLALADLAYREAAGLMPGISSTRHGDQR